MDNRRRGKGVGDCRLLVPGNKAVNLRSIKESLGGVNRPRKNPRGENWVTLFFDDSHHPNSMHASRGGDTGKPRVLSTSNSEYVEFNMPIRYCRAALLLGAIFLGSLAAQSNPLPPTHVCVNGKCSSAIAPSPGSAGIKWHPGHYVWLDPHSSQAAQMAAIDALSSDTTVQGVQLLINWAYLEGSTPGDYSNGFALVDGYLAKLASLKVPKRLILGVTERSFGTPPPAGTVCADAASKLLPSYLASLSDGGCAIALPGAAGGLAVTARFWDAPVMDRLIALSQAYAQRYDQNPLFEMFFGNGETAVAAPPGSNFSMAAYAVQLKRWFDASEKVWTHTQLRLAANYAGSDAQMLDLINYATANGGVIVGGPDPELPLPDITRPVQANEIFRGAAGGTDFRGVVPWVGEIQGYGLGVKFTQLPSDVFAYNSDTMHASYMIWLRNTWLGGAPQMWSSGILPFIQSVQGKVKWADCPAAYQQRCNTN